MKNSGIRHLTSHVADVIMGLLEEISSRRRGMSVRTSCEMCSNYVYDEDYDYYVCEMDLDEDEMYRFLSSSVDSCPYFRGEDEYMIVRKQM